MYSSQRVDIVVWLRVRMAFVLLMGVCVSGCARPAAEANEQENAILLLSDSTHHFGTIREGEVVECSFTLTNGGDGVLRFEVQPPDCACISVRPMSGALAPDECQRLRVAFDSRGFLGSEFKRVTLRTNTPRGRVHLLIMSNVCQ